MSARERTPLLTPPPTREQRLEGAGLGRYGETAGGACEADGQRFVSNFLLHLAGLMTVANPPPPSGPAVAAQDPVDPDHEMRLIGRGDNHPRNALAPTGEPLRREGHPAPGSGERPDGAAGEEDQRRPRLWPGEGCCTRAASQGQRAERRPRPRHGGVREGGRSARRKRRPARARAHRRQRASLRVAIEEGRSCQAAHPACRDVSAQTRGRPGSASRSRARSTRSR